MHENPGYMKSAEKIKFANLYNMLVNMYKSLLEDMENSPDLLDHFDTVYKDLNKSGIPEGMIDAAEKVKNDILFAGDGRNNIKERYASFMNTTNDFEPLRAYADGLGLKKTPDGYVS